MSINKQNLNSPLAQFNFDEWANLATRDPGEFEQRRQNCIEQFIGRYPASRQKRLRGLQFRIDMERKRARTPMGACVKLSSMMWDTVMGDEGFVSTVKLLVEPGNHSDNSPKPGLQKRESAKILYFNKNKVKH